MAQTMRVFEIAAELRITTLSVLKYLKQLGYDIARNQMQPVTDEMHLALLCKFDDKRVDQFAADRPGFNELMSSLKRKLKMIKSNRSSSQDISKRDRYPRQISRKEKAPDKQSKIALKEYSHTENQPMTATSSGIQNAFSSLMETLQEELKSIAKSSTQAIEKGDYEAARAPLEQAANISKLLGKLTDLRKEWDLLFKEVPVEVPTMKAVKPPVVGRRGKYRLPLGSLTPIKAFIQPVLQTLSDMDGKGARIDIINNLSKTMAGTLNEFDMQPQPSRPKTPRCHITIERLHTSMIKSGLLSKSTQLGIWEISQKGRELLKESSAK